MPDLMAKLVLHKSRFQENNYINFEFCEVDLGGDRYLDFEIVTIFWKPRMAATRIKSQILLPFDCNKLFLPDTGFCENLVTPKRDYGTSCHRFFLRFLRDVALCTRKLW